MFHEIMEELRHVRLRLDSHIDDKQKSLDGVKDEISKIRIEMREHKTRIGMIAGMIAFAVTTAVTWIVGGFER